MKDDNAPRENNNAPWKQRGRREEHERAERGPQRAEALDEQTRPTTFGEYIAACHSSVFSRLVIETDPKLTSKDSMTNPRDKWCPKNLRPRSSFLDQQKLTFAACSKTETSWRAQTGGGRRQGVSDRRWCVVFENHPHALSDIAEEVVERETRLTPPRTPDHRRDLNQLRPD
ncbi:unnamed protein product [Fusarium graminearum]|uniref:Uncharacterized protein n=1 Tax=Gibberella zeae TaxID=5518 RepID=A0A4E9EGT1_GIBZA|nr:unnamed protein product [Fusarium graminearum]